MVLKLTARNQGGGYSEGANYGNNYASEGHGTRDDDYEDPSYRMQQMSIQDEGGR